MAAILGTILVLCFVLLRFPPGQYSFYPVCPIYAWTGFLCPGCGGTRALAALLHGHLAEAWHWNPLIFAVIPLILICAAWRPRLPTVIWIGTILAVCLFGVLRNL